jgi:hypothetical protein
MPPRKLILLGAFISFLFRFGFVGILFLSAGEVETPWLMWALLIVMSVLLTRSLYITYNVIKIILSVGKIK